MNTEAMEKEVHERIPMSQLIGMKLRKFDSGLVELWFPEVPNQGQMSTAFGGSLYSAGVLACYILFRRMLVDFGIPEGKFLNHEGNIEYLSPIKGEFKSHAEYDVQSDEFVEFIKSFASTGRGCLQMKADIVFNGKCAARFQALFFISPN